MSLSELTHFESVPVTSPIEEDVDYTIPPLWKAKQTQSWPSGGLSFLHWSEALKSKIEVAAGVLSWGLMHPFLWGIFMQIWLFLTEHPSHAESWFAVQTQHKTELVMLIEHWTVTYWYLLRSNAYAWLKSKHRVGYGGELKVLNAIRIGLGWFYPSVGIFLTVCRVKLSFLLNKCRWMWVSRW